jgi:hypothetical protein
MMAEEFFNDPITVTTSMDEAGHISPKSLIWQGTQYILTATGRQWDVDDGRHVLVEAANGDRFEIQLSRKDLLWYLRRAWRGLLAV